MTFFTNPLKNQMKISPLLNERGNALWFILVAVVLIAALTMVLTRSGSNITSSGDSEKLKLQYTQLMRYGQSVAAGIEQLKAKGCSENQISFVNDIISVIEYDNTNAPADNSCHVFNAAGAGLTIQPFSNFSTNVLTDLAENIVFSGSFLITGNAGDTGPQGSELTMFVGISETLCKQINSDLNISTTPADYTVATIGGWDVRFTGIFSSDHEIPADGGAALENTQTGCLIDGNNQPVFYYILMAR